jgi:hypothetical protein
LHSCSEIKGLVKWVTLKCLKKRLAEVWARSKMRINAVASGEPRKSGSTLTPDVISTERGWVGAGVNSMGCVWGAASCATTT